MCVGVLWRVGIVGLSVLVWVCWCECVIAVCWCAVLACWCGVLAKVFVCCWSVLVWYVNVALCCGMYLHVYD